MQASSLKTTILAPKSFLLVCSVRSWLRGGCMSWSVAELVQQRSMLVILIAACTAARTAFEAADNWSTHSSAQTSTE